MWRVPYSVVGDELRPEGTALVVCAWSTVVDEGTTAIIDLIDPTPDCEAAMDSSGERI
ncbi:hypothetical protein JCM17845_15570 [Iodidimonas gelatinilytica]|uniref:Uncharacterized protein n=1 Tax=Iodidimonas gelatinilytica TaxID=1236966 RepID=A0A5A7MZU7_9PROT|nr:hypothetical protein JCM17845_15570 [Iodidimonas gelatinilytica]